MAWGDAGDTGSPSRMDEREQRAVEVTEAALKVPQRCHAPQSGAMPPERCHAPQSGAMHLSGTMHLSGRPVGFLLHCPHTDVEASSSSLDRFRPVESSLSSRSVFNPKALHPLRSEMGRRSAGLHIARR